MPKRKTNGILRQLMRKATVWLHLVVRKAGAFYGYCAGGVWNDVDGGRTSAWVKTLNLAVNSFASKRLPQKACALTYSTVLALVPILAMLFAIGRGFGFQNILQSELFRYFPSQRNALNSSFSFVDRYLEQTSQGLFVGIGVVFLLWTLISLMRNVESSFNEIWGVRRNRSIYRQVTDYTVVFLFMPVLMLLSAGLNLLVTTGINQVLDIDVLSPVVQFLLDLSPMMIAWLVFSCAFWLIPNTPVKAKPAFVAGVACGTVTHVLQMLFVGGQVYVSKYNAIYGSFAFLPLLLIWLQLVWLITLAGMVMTYSMQTASSLSYSGHIRHISVNYFNQVTVLLLAIISRRFNEHRNPLGTSELAAVYGLPPSLVQMSIQRLVDIGLLNRVDLHENAVAYQPAYPVGDRLTIREAFGLLNDYGQHDFMELKDRQLADALTLLRNLSRPFSSQLDMKIDELLKND